MSDTAAAQSRAVQYQIDPQHTGALFKVRHLMISWVKGTLGPVAGTVQFDPADLAGSRIDVSIPAASINTGEPQRDTHLKSADFFDVEKYPDITFRSKSIQPDGKDSYKAAGDLTIRGVTREVTLIVEGLTPEVKDPWGFFRRAASARTKINRQDFAVAYNSVLETGGFMIGDEVDISIDVELVRKAE
jgi:polyisoprenoid-binding protein YceI